MKKNKEKTEEPLQQAMDDSPIKKKKKSKRKEQANLEETPQKDVAIPQCDITPDKPKKKKKKDLSNDVSSEVKDSLKKKKKQSKEKSVDHEKETSVVLEEPEPSKKMKKQKKKDVDVAPTDQTEIALVSQSHDYIDSGENPKKKKKSKSGGDEAEVNNNVDETHKADSEAAEDLAKAEDSRNESKTKKKKSKKRHIENNQEHNDGPVCEDDQSVPEQSESHKKKKKKRKRDKSDAVDQESGEGDISKDDEINESLSRETESHEVTEPPKKKKKKDNKKTEDEPHSDPLKNGGVSDKKSLTQNRVKEEDTEKSGASNAAPVAGQWATADLGSSDRQNKFMRLLGGFKKGNEGKPSLYGASAKKVGGNFAFSGQQQNDVNQKLEQQYQQALGFKLNKNKGGGLGFEPDPIEGKKFHINVHKTKSMKFDD